MADDLDEYLASLLHTEAPAAKLLRSVEDAAHRAQQSVRAKLLSGETEVAEEPGILSIKIGSLQEKQKKEYEEQIREHRLKEALRAKKELEDKLAFLSDTINVLSSHPDADAPKPKHSKVTDKEARKQLQEAEEAKRKESLEFAKKQMELQRDRQRRRQMQVQHLADTLHLHIEHDKQQRTEIERKLREEKERRLEMLKQQAEARQEELALARQRLKAKIHSEKPPVTMPELENRRQELARKRLPGIQNQLYKRPSPDDSKRPLPIVLEEEKPAERRARLDRKLAEIAAKQAEVSRQRNSQSSGKQREEPSHRPVNSSMSEGELAAAKPPLPRVKPKADLNNGKGDSKDERMHEALERFKSSKVSFDSASTPRSGTQPALKKQEMPVAAFKTVDGDGVISSIREKLSLLRS